ncbi:MAG: pyrroline-5-carboxylate reductase [Verrucomicrobium sp.]|nr:pyrroline-5-carboxylate reductase [Verrucomicrobium sp.]
MNKHLVLVGMMGSGKTTVANWLHRQGGMPFYDTDHLIEQREKKTIPEIFRERGESYFREQERLIASEVAGRTPGVIATGGGLFADAESRRVLLEKGVVFYLEASAKELADRIRHTAHRPLLKDKPAAETLEELLKKRDADYRQAHHVVSIARRSTEEVAAEILSLYRREGKRPVLGFLGTGKMARALASGLAAKAAGSVAFPFLGTARSADSRAAFTASLPGRSEALEDNRALVERADVVLLGIKPAQAAEVLPPLREAAAGKLFVSLLAGLKLSRLQELLGPQARVVRSMPNTPTLIGEGVTAYAAGPGVTEGDLALVQTLLESCGLARRVEEKELDAVTAVSGSGPAYVYHFLNALIEGGIEQGLSPEAARELAVQTVRGAAGMVAASSESPLALAAQVKSPNGTTLAGCRVLEEGNWEKILREAVAAARARSEALSKEL